ncbi:porphobilinogen deaminase [Pseudopedobacter saltans DSM 12145]|uniref:Hydroxymethylbilane synthase n=1 Tax=Pseudopedobacter saltans (strain ATCC 51119 / DSM 12145 / JCM 21818 / CCUG 39354 / LMG 10337 / NBRC 100064 / NCIMB 13643) TaxID=762903 RepID=F0SEE3_PSESL|nr:hydroxymethylbilane synthase [Pseudopedobacter saltans]ADY50808.1 porphobilinogen deaminase [Pseudopedobacter saltans DSM 12145]
MDRIFKIGTRGSDLALWQANHVASKLNEAGYQTEIKIIKTQGDNILNLRLDKLEGKGFFTKELEEHLLAGDIDLAVHSHKDLPTENPPGLFISAVSEREDPSEVLLILKDCVDTSKKLSVKHNGLVGTSSNRRQSQISSVRPDLEFEDLRGNVNTRIQKLRDENYDAIVLAKAGVSRLNLDLSEFYIETIEPVAEMIPAPAQGVLAVQIREGDSELDAVLKEVIHNQEVANCISVERKVLNLFNGGCHMPLGSYCKKEDDIYKVWTSKANEAEEFVDRLYLESETTEGLAEIIVSKFDYPNRNLPKKVFISRELSEYSYFARAMAKHEIEIDARSLIKTVPTIHKIDSYIFKHFDWIFFNSKNAIEYFFNLDPVLPKNIKFGVVGRGSEDALRLVVGRVPDFIGESSDTAEIAEEFATVANGTNVLFPLAKDSLRSIVKGLSPDTKIKELVVYETILLDDVDKSYADVLVFTSPSNVEAYFENNLLDPEQKIVSIGASTGKKLEEINITSYILPASPDEIGLAEAVFGIDIK